MLKQILFQYCIQRVEKKRALVCCLSATISADFHHTFSRYGGFVWKKWCCLFLDGAECRWTQGSLQCFTVVLTFKSRQGSCAEALKNNQFPSLLLILLTLDHYHCGTLRRLGMRNLYRASTIHGQREETERGFNQHAHTLEACVKANANTILSLWRKNKSSLSLSLNINTYKQNTSMTEKLKRPPK